MKIYELTYSIEGDPQAEYFFSKRDTYQRVRAIQKHDGYALDEIVLITAPRANPQMVLAILNQQAWALSRKTLANLAKGQS